MSSWSAAGVRLYIEWIRRSKVTFGNAEKTRKSIKDLYIHPQSFFPPADLGHDIVVERIDLNEWPLYRVSSRHALEKESSDESRHAMVYIHGGAFFREIDQAHWKFIAQAARETGLDILVPIYPLIPRPTATAKQIVSGLVKICLLSKQPVIGIAGDSAGGSMALAAMQHMHDILPDLAAQIRFLVLISPVLDCALDHPEVVRLDKTDPWLGVDGLRVLTPLWAAGLSTTDPLVSPLYGDIAHLPPLLLLCGTADMLCADARRLSARFQGEDVSKCVPGSIELENFTYVEHADMIHVYPLLPHWEGAQARKLIVAFISKQLE
jgi:acetyl esterase/lipase